MGAPFGNKYWLGKKHSKVTKLKISRIVKGRKHSEESKSKMGWQNKNNKYWVGKKHSEASKLKMSESHKGKGVGQDNARWVEDRSLVISNCHKDTTEYRKWRKSVYSRDNHKCRLSDGKCSGRLEAHHIFDWINYRELRYLVSNGITVCLKHHPHSRSEEERMRPIFQELIK